jgi:hypothetical protein
MLESIPLKGDAMFRKALLIGFVVALGSNVIAPAFAQEWTLQDAADAWKRTQERVQSAKFEWTSRVWMKQGTGVPPMESSEPIPNRDVTFEYQRTMVFRDGLVRYENAGPTWDPTEEKYIDLHGLYAWNGESATDFNGNRKRPYAFINAVNIQLTQDEVRPIQYAFRMFHPDWFMFTADDYEITNQNARVGELNCLVVETASRLLKERVARGRKPLKSVSWFCPDRDFSLIRFAGVNEETGEITLQFDIQHTFDAEAETWVPQEWTITRDVTAGPSRIETSTVKSYALNPAVADDTFTINLPANTTVTDLVTGEDYIVRKDDEKRVITRDELLRGATHKELLETESGQAALRKSQKGGLLSSPVTYIAAIGVLLLIAAAVLFVRTRTA